MQEGSLLAKIASSVSHVELSDSWMCWSRFEHDRPIA
ncbi:unnamed protein product [Rhodiola kirilowii]